MPETCQIVELRPATPSPLEAAVYAAKDAWFASEQFTYQATAAAKNVKAYLADRDEQRAACGKAIATAQRLYRESGNPKPWKEWAPEAFGWSYMTITRRMKDYVEPEAAGERRAAQTKRDRSVKVTRNADRVTIPQSVPVEHSPPLPSFPSLIITPTPLIPDSDFDHAVEVVKALDIVSFARFKEWFLAYSGAIKP